jgi:hypothetical protein
MLPAGAVRAQGYPAKPIRIVTAEIDSALYHALGKLPESGIAHDFY